MGSIYKDLCNKISYDAYYKFDKELIGFNSIFSLFTFFTKQYSISEYPNDFIILMIIVFLLVKKHSFGQLYTMDVQEIRDLYNVFLKKYNKLNRLFDLKNPIEISTMYNFLVYKGYLSRYRKFVFSDDETVDINGFFGADVFSGGSVCRHISALLCDILNDYGISSNQLCVYAKNYFFNVYFTPNLIKSKEELLAFARSRCVDETSYKELSHIIDSVVEHNRGVDFFESSEDEKSFFKRLYGNHAITYAVFDGKNYFLDPSQDRVYKRSSSNGRMIYDKERELFFRNWSSFSLNKLSDFFKINKNLLINKNSNVTDDEIYKMVSNTKNLCNDNLDIFDKFYCDNKDLYDEIAVKTFKL